MIGIYSSNDQYIDMLEDQVSSLAHMCDELAEENVKLKQEIEEYKKKLILQETINEL